MTAKRALYRTNRWREARTTFLKDKGCNWNPDHKGPYTIDHLTYLNADGSMMNNEDLLNFETLYARGDLLVLCRRCAYARRTNKIICNVCGENYHARKYKMCFNCLVKANPEDYVTCKECGKNHHLPRWTMCASCHKKLKKSRSSKKGWDTRRGQGRKK